MSRMQTGDGQHFVIVRTVEAWTAQARAAQAAIVAANGGIGPPTIRDCYDADPAAFASLIEAMVALEPVTGRPVAADLAVHASNMTKVVPGPPVLNADGKILKGPGYEPPRIAAALGLDGTS